MLKLSLLLKKMAIDFGKLSEILSRVIRKIISIKFFIKHDFLTQNFIYSA